MKAILLVTVLATLAGAAEQTHMPNDFMDFAYMNTGAGSLMASEILVAAKNPYSRAIVQRVIGWVLVGSGVVSMLIARPYGELMGDPATLDADFYTGLMLIEGGAEATAGGILLGIGYYKYSQWKNWKREHTGSPAGGFRLSFTVPF